MLKIQNALEQAGIHFTDDETGEIGVRLQVGKRSMKRSPISSIYAPPQASAAASAGWTTTATRQCFDPNHRKNSRSLSVTTAWPKISA